MLIRKRKGWEIAERLVTPEPMALNRRAFLAGGAGAIAGAAGLAPDAWATTDVQTPSDSLFPAKLNPKFADAGRKITTEAATGSYNNFYEFGPDKGIARAAQALKTRPWTIKIDGLVEKPFEIGIDDLMAKMPMEERVYRHRCVEAWSMVVPWTGFVMKDLLALAKPLSSAKYVRMETFLDKTIAPGQAASFYDWPYVEGLTIEEAANDLTLMVTGAYGRPLAKQFGAPIRLHTPWKYGFKSIKSITRISFTDKRPKSFWEGLQASEYGFWANVNPAVSHPRWSQAEERVLGAGAGAFGGGEKIPTVIYNGYGEFVASLYKDIKGERLFV